MQIKQLANNPTNRSFSDTNAAALLRMAESRSPQQRAIVYRKICEAIAQRSKNMPL